MNTARTLRWARNRAGLTQRELAARTGVSQPAIACIERGRERPRADTLDGLLRACGLMLEATPLERAGVDRSLPASSSPPRPTADRLRSARSTGPSRALAGHRDDVTPDLIGILESLDSHGVRFVVIGGLAANLLGSPILTNDVDICYGRDE